MIFAGEERAIYDMIRYAGMILIAVSCTAGGFFFSGKIKYRIEQVEHFLNFFDSIITGIEVYKYPVEKIFAAYRNKDLEFFTDRLMQNGRIHGVYKNPWEVSLKECADGGFLFLKHEEFDIVKDFGAKLGEGRAEEQAAHMNLYAGKLKALYKGSYERELNLATLYRWSGGLIGIFICILLI